MASIHVDTITSINQQELGTDEIRMLFIGHGGSELWSNKMDMEEETNSKNHSVHPSETFHFQDFVELRLYEVDEPLGTPELVFQARFDEPSLSGGSYERAVSFFSPQYNSEYKVNVTVLGDRAV
jgi:hypothetical protein